ncbi:uncharacterized protein LOC123504311 isoform X3 [Portunus trituberculatus]|uniref:uncharacterized protein LOC123504311 isoform X3 n=1 Tax=Portunus trituberculatus TaxID=210409 RepID=UPI001E1CE30F|nr:uncharacterized protein LOC123504311 isoform X3 [Portunus trituberculatus]
MDRLRNIKNRLSVSVDKLSPSRRSKSQQRQSEHLGNVPASTGDIPGSLKTSRVEDRPSSAFEVSASAGSSSRPTSYCEVDLDETLSEEWLPVEDLAGAVAESKTSPQNEMEASPGLTVDPTPLKRSTPTIHGDSLMSEVMKEVEKMSELSEGMNVEPKNPAESVGKGATSVDGTQQETEAKAEDDRPTPCSPGRSKSEETLVAAEEVSLREEGEKTSPGDTFDSPAACRTESLTSGYFSDSDVTLSEGKCDSVLLKSPLRISENAENNKSAFTSVIPESHTKSAFSSLKRDTSEYIHTSISIESKTEASICSTVTNVASTSQTTTTYPAASHVEQTEPSQVAATAVVQDKKTKKESLYSRIMRKKDPSKEPIYSKKNTSKEPIYSKKSATKEPIYARIKPKLTAETSFQPIEPSTGKNTCHDMGGSDVVKPEPMYSPAGVSVAGVPSYPSGSTAAFVPMEPKVSFPDKKVDLAYSQVKPREIRSNTLPREPVYSTVKKNSGSLPKELTPGKVKEHIYNTPLPLTPREEALLRRESFYSHASSDYGKVTVRVGEITPSVPAIITISNPGYAAPPVAAATLSSPPLASGPEPPASSTAAAVSSPKTNPDQEPSTSTLQSETKEKSECVPKVPVSQPSIQRENSFIESNTESADRSKLSQLVEELAQELEAASHHLPPDEAADYKSKKEVLAKLLATYDVPKNLRRVEEVDENAALEAEQALVPSGVSMDELRYVDDNEDNAETVYADVPDYSQDEFVIALDDENDPRYASLTRALRQHKAGGESPGKVSKRSATVYANALNVVTALRVLINSKSTRAASVINKMGTLARPYAHRMHDTITDTSWIQRVIFHKSGHNGFDELRRYIKSGGEFCKELATIMHERAELEASYAKGLYKLSSKLMKASKETSGTITQAWQMVGVEMEQQGDVHRSIASAIGDDVVRPLRQLIETQHKIRKGVESMVDKTTKNLHEWRAAESKSKKQSYNNCRENEKIQDMMLEARLGRGKTLTDKETIKMEKQRRKAEEAVQKSDLEYYTCCIRAERARLEWESAVYKGSSCFQTLEEERLQALRDLVVKYHKNALESSPKTADRLEEPVKACDVEKDIQAVIAAKGTGENIPEQMLPDFYGEDMNNIMNRERRREALEKFIKMVRTDLERERRGKQGVENLAKALQETPTFGGEESQQDVNDKLQHDAYNRLQHMKAMLAYLEAARYKIQCSIDELGNRPKTVHPLAKHIEVHRDKQGYTCSVLKVPTWVRGNSVDVSPASNSPTGSPYWNDRGTADGNSVQPDSDFDEFSSQGSDRDYQATMNDENAEQNIKDIPYYAHPLPTAATGSRCKALYDYEANMYDELTIRTGDIINIHEKQADGWWVGELDSVVGMFPATYVEEID